jgi:hypothetical protein
MARRGSISPKERAILIIAHKIGNDISLYAMSFGVDDAEFARREFIFEAESEV